jgi:hypothetical protein
MADEINNGAAAAAGTPELPVVERITVPAATALGLDEAPGASLERQAAAMRSNNPDDAANAAAVAKPAAKPDETPAVKPDEAAAKPAETPAAKPDEAAAKPAETPVKVKIGGKEYTQEELEKALAAKAQAATVAEPAAQPAEAAPKPPTPEEVEKAEAEWCVNFAKESKLKLAPTTEEMETILSGGEDSAKLLAQKFSEVAAKAVLLARKSIYNDLNPTLNQIQQNLTPLLTSNAEVSRVAAEQVFFNSHPDLKEHAATARSVADALLARYPAECQKMSPEQLMNEVARQTDRILQDEYKRWNPTATNTWRDARKAAAPAPAPAAKPAAPAPAAAAPAAKPAVAAPASNSPAASPASGGGKSWHQSTASSLRD